MKLLVLPLFGLSIAAAQEPAVVQMPTQGGENISFAYADVLRAIPTYDEIVEVASECAVVDANSDVDADSADADAGNHVLTLGLANSAMHTCNAESVPSQERRITGYEVEYRYKGEIYMSHMGYDPGDKLRIRIAIAPAD